MGTATRKAAAAAAVAALFAVSLWWFNYIPDDAYIGMRYARNLAGGEGLVFNPGERVEGYEDFLWVALLAAGDKAGMPAAAGARILSLLFSAGALALTRTACLRAVPHGESGREGAAAAGAAFLAAAAPFTACALSGTGVPLFTFLLTAGMLMIIGGRGHRPVLAVFALLAMARPEGAAYYLLAVSLLAARKEGPAVARRRLLIEAAAVAALVIVPYTAWRAAWFGSVVPNTWYVRTGGASLRNGISDAARFAAWYGWLPAGALLLVRRGFAGVTVPLSFICLNLLIAVLLGGDWAPQYRLLVLTLPSFAVMAAGAVHRAPVPAGGAHNGPAQARRTLALAAVLVCVAVAPGTADHGRFVHDRRLVKAWGWVGEALGSRLPGGTVLACGSTGAIGFYSGLPVIDILGMTEPEIAVRGRIVSDQPGRMRARGGYVLDRAPDLLLLGNVLIHSGTREEDLGRVKIQERDIVLDPRFDSDYRFINFPLGDGFFLSCYARVGSPLLAPPAGSSSR